MVRGRTDRSSAIVIRERFRCRTDRSSAIVIRERCEWVFKSKISKHFDILVALIEGF